MFLRPRRWGKTTFLQMLANYYDSSKDHEFDDIFGQLYIGKNPTEYRNSFLVVLFDFSKISVAPPDETKKQLNSTMLRSLRNFWKPISSSWAIPLRSLLCDDGAEALQNVLVSLLISISALLPHYLLCRSL